MGWSAIEGRNFLWARNGIAGGFGIMRRIQEGKFGGGGVFSRTGLGSVSMATSGFGLGLTLEAILREKSKGWV